MPLVVLDLPARPGVAVPIYGKVADLYGRKPVMLLGIALFVVGSLLCGIAWGMPALIVSRLAQGLGWVPTRRSPWP